MIYRVTDHGLIGDGKTDNSAAFRALIQQTEDHSEIVFPAGQYLFRTCVDINGKHDLILRGETGATLLTHFGPCGDPHENNDLFHINHCSDLQIMDFTVTTDAPIGWAGRVTAVNPEEHYYEVRIYDEFEITGYEHPVALNSCDADGTPDYRFGGAKWRDAEVVVENGVEKTVRYPGFDYQIVGDHLLRFPVEPNADLSRLPIGEQMCYRFIVYGNSHFCFGNTDRVLMKNIEIERASSMGAIVGIRCSDFTFDHFNIRLAKNTQALYSANADGIHINGLTGYLNMFDCHFDGLGDDTLNIHGIAGEIMEIEGDRMKFMHRHRSGHSPLASNWACPGDVIEVYDSATFVRKGTLTVGEYAPDGYATITATTGTYAVGDALANTAYYATTHLRNCVAKNTRARGFLLQTRNVLVEYCEVWGMSLPAIIVSPDIKVWYEVGPSDNVVIRNNRFEKCAFIHSAANLGAIVVKGCHDAGADDYPAGVHRNMTIEGNYFRNLGNSGIYVSATEGVTVRDNRFESCSVERFDPNRACTAYDIVTVNCDKVTVEGNHTDKAPDQLFYPENCTAVQA